MKKLLAFALVLSLGVFCAMGCKDEKKKDAKDTKPPVVNPDKGAPATPPVTPKEEPKKDK